jgi:type IV fimbrial biogenesis protein FimT
MRSYSLPGRGCIRASQSGFTLVEMMIAIAVFAIFISIAIPSTREWTNNRQVSLLAESIAAGLRQAQIEAIQRSAPVQFVMTTTNVVPASTDPSSVTLSAGGLSASNPAVNLLVRVQGATTAATGFVSVQQSTQGWQNARVLAQSGGASVTGVAFSSLGRMTNTINSTGVLNAVGGTGKVVFQVINPSLPSDTTRRRCVVVSSGGAAKVCDPTISTGDARACLPQVTATECPGS